MVSKMVSKMDNLYDIYFAGRLLEGFNEDQVRSNLASLFKADDKILDTLFSGKPQLLKKGVDKAGAIKYKTAMHKAGAMIAVRSQSTETGPKPAAQQATPAESTPSTREEEFSFAAVGSDVLSDDERQHIEPVAIDNSDLQVASPFSEPEAQTAPAPPAPDTSHISLATARGDIPNIETINVLVEPDISDISLAPEGIDFSDYHGDGIPVMEPDTGAISLAPSGSNLIEDDYEKKDLLPPPSTDHLQLEKENSGKADFDDKPRVIV